MQSLGAKQERVQHSHEDKEDKDKGATHNHLILLQLPLDGIQQFMGHSELIIYNVHTQI